MKLFTKFITEKDLPIIIENIISKMNATQRQAFIENHIKKVIEKSIKYASKKEERIILNSVLEIIETKKNDLDKNTCENPDYMCC